MKNTIKQVFHSGKFLVGFVIFVFILVYIIVYPLVVATSPMEMIGNGNFFLRERISPSRRQPRRATAIS